MARTHLFIIITLLSLPIQCISASDKFKALRNVIQSCTSKISAVPVVGSTMSIIYANSQETSKNDWPKIIVSELKKESGLQTWPENTYNMVTKQSSPYSLLWSSYTPHMAIMRDPDKDVAIIAIKHMRIDPKLVGVLSASASLSRALYTIKPCEDLTTSSSRTATIMNTAFNAGALLGHTSHATTSVLLGKQLLYEIDKNFYCIKEEDNSNNALCFLKLTDTAFKHLFNQSSPK